MTNRGRCRYRLRDNLNRSGRGAKRRHPHMSLAQWRRRADERISVDKVGIGRTYFIYNTACYGRMQQKRREERLTQIVHTVGVCTRILHVHVTVARILERESVAYALLGVVHMFVMTMSVMKGTQKSRGRRARARRHVDQKHQQCQYPLRPFHLRIRFPAINYISTRPFSVSFPTQRPASANAVWRSMS